MFVFSGGGPLLGYGSRGMGQSGAAETEDEAPGGLSEDLSGTLFCCESSALHHFGVV